MRGILILALLVGGVVSPALAQKVYVTVDKNGMKHYSDKPSVNAKEVRLDVSQPASGNGMSDQASTAKKPTLEVDNPVEDPLTAGWEQGSAPNEKIAPSKQAACDLAKRNLSVLSDSSQFALTRDDQGNAQVMDKDKRSEALALAQENVSSYCE